MKVQGCFLVDNGRCQTVRDPPLVYFASPSLMLITPTWEVWFRSFSFLNAWFLGEPAVHLPGCKAPSVSNPTVSSRLGNWWHHLGPIGLKIQLETYCNFISEIIGGLYSSPEVPKQKIICLSWSKCKHFSSDFFCWFSKSLWTMGCFSFKWNIF